MPPYQNKKKKKKKKIYNSNLLFFFQLKRINFWFARDKTILNFLFYDWCGGVIMKLVIFDVILLLGWTTKLIFTTLPCPFYPLKTNFSDPKANQINT